ncbi:MAG: MBL fold metallo-hydrolase, partial [Bdellovibrionales bacterium]|nr:MBL fold metallo-hydrolase [Bdellovibrionales bacterium]
QDTFTLTFVVSDPSTHDAVIIDPVLNYDPKASTYSMDSINEACEYVKGKNLNLHYILETHAHADHLSGSQFIKNNFPKAKIAIAERIIKVQELFKSFFNFGEEFIADGSQFDELLVSGETFKAGSLWFKTLPTPGHTPACSSYLTEGGVFTGDALFMPDYGTGRCDFPAGSAEDLYNSIMQQLYTLPEDTKVYVGHDYLPNGRSLQFQTTIGESKNSNIRLKSGTTKEEFISYRQKRDAELEAPKLLLQSVQTNIRAGKFSVPESNGTSYLKIPIRPA